MLISMNWIQDFVDLSGLDLDQLIQRICSKWIRAAAWWTVSAARQTSGRECSSPLLARVAVYAPAKLGKRR